MTTPYYEYLKQHEHRYGRSPLGSQPIVLPPTPPSSIFDEEFTPTDFRFVVRAWKLKHGVLIDDEITAITPLQESDQYGECDANEPKNET